MEATTDNAQFDGLLKMLNRYSETYMIQGYSLETAEEMALDKVSQRTTKKRFAEFEAWLDN